MRRFNFYPVSWAGLHDDGPYRLVMEEEEVRDIFRGTAQEALRRLDEKTRQLKKNLRSLPRNVIKECIWVVKALQTAVQCRDINVSAALHYFLENPNELEV